jgi:hypothetical protein
MSDISISPSITAKPGQHQTIQHLTIYAIIYIKKTAVKALSLLTATNPKVSLRPKNTTEGTGYVKNPVPSVVYAGCFLV